MKTNAILFHFLFLAFFISPLAQAEEALPNVGHGRHSSEATELLAKVNGVYKKRFKNGDISGATYQGEDVFEFVPVSDVASYIRIHLDFFNGHMCGISGIAEYKTGGEFVFQDPAGDHQCLLTIRLDQNLIKFEDPNGNCQKFCGSRGGFNNQVFELKQKRMIRYMPTILESWQYKEALQSYQKRHQNDK